MQEYGTQRKQYSWSAHSLHKLFIEHEMSNEKETMLKLLARPSDDKHDEAGVQMRNTIDFSAEEDKKLWFSLCALYLTQEYIKETPLGTGILPEELNNLRRNAIEPVTRLLAVPISERWTRSAQSSAKQIYLHYIYNSTLHHGIYDLLALPISTFPMLQALQDIATIESGTPLLDENSGAVMKSLLNFLKNLCSTNDRRTAIAAGVVFVELSRNILHHGVIISSGILDTIATILLSESDTGLLVVSTTILTVLTYNDPESSAEIAKQPRVLDGLVKLLFDEENPEVPHSALLALGNLGVHVKEFAVMALNYPRAVEQVVNLLSKTDNPALQIMAIGILGVLVPHARETTQNIFDYPSAFKYLLEFMLKNDSPHLQESAALALRHLTHTTTQDMSDIIVGYPRVIEKLFSSMCRDDSPVLQVQATKAFMHLAASDDDIIVRQLLNLPGVMEQPVNVLSKDNNVELQDVAVCTLYQLASCLVNETRLRKMHSPGLLEKFFSSLSNEKFHRKIAGGCAFVEVLTLIDPARGNIAGLHTAPAYECRGYANICLGLNMEALEDLNRADEIESGNVSILWLRRTVRAMLGDFQGALVDSNSIIEKQHTAFNFQESGVLKRMMGDFPGALEDLNESLVLDPDDYEVLKHRGFVRFLMNDDHGACADAERAQRIKRRRVECIRYGRNCLGTTSVEFMGYKLR
ncbi:unnamed protein product [Calypogeia fissa]